ncbi:MAG: Hpt domain-containing protein [Verrucomicrobiota bacterium]|jgi:HPt (histidine-containing phosphotransfer) domain-containing protein
MPKPPNPSLVDLANVLGEENVRNLVRTFLTEFPVSFETLRAGDGKNRHRVAHSLKGNTRLMGANELSQRFAEIEARMEESPGSEITVAELESLRAEFEILAGPLRRFAGV